jgi:hypothetical protein
MKLGRCRPGEKISVENLPIEGIMSRRITGIKDT